MARNWSDGMIKVKLRIHDAPQILSVVAFTKATDSIRTFIHHVQVSFRIRRVRTLHFNRKRLDTDPTQTLSSYNVQSGSTLTLLAESRSKHQQTTYVHVQVVSQPPVRVGIWNDTTLAELNHLIQNHTLLRMPAEEQLLLHDGKRLRCKRLRRTCFESELKLVWEPPSKAGIHQIYVSLLFVCYRIRNKPCNAYH